MQTIARHLQSASVQTIIASPPSPPPAISRRATKIREFAAAAATVGDDGDRASQTLIALVPKRRVMWDASACIAAPEADEVTVLWERSEDRREDPIASGRVLAFEAAVANEDLVWHEERQRRRSLVEVEVKSSDERREDATIM